MQRRPLQSLVRWQEPYTATGSTIETMQTIRLQAVDAIWLLMESPQTPMHVGVLAIFERPEDAPEDYLIQLAATMRQARALAPPWNCRLARPDGPSMTPRLIEERSVDLDYHFRHTALPAGGGERELGVKVSRLHSHALDRHRPLWEFHLIEGLEGGRFAFYVKVHHALVGNVNGVPMVMAALADSAQEAATAPLWTRPLVGGEPAAADDAGVEQRLREQFDPVAALRPLGRAASAVLTSAVKSLTSGGGLPLLRNAPPSTLNRRINSQRRFATQQFELQRIERLAKASDSTLLDILIYCCGSSLRRFFKEYNALPDESLIGILPLSLQRQGGARHGNAVAAGRVAMGTDIGDPLARLAAVKQSVRQVAEDSAALPEEAFGSYVMIRGAPIYASQLRGIQHLVPPLFNLRVTHITGSDRPRYFSGARLQAIYPLAHLMQFSALSIGFVSYAGTLNIGFTGARDTLPHLQRLAVYFGKAVSDLEELVAEEEGAR